MGCRKKSEIEAESSAQSDLVVCPICGKEFRPTEETYCWVREGLHKYTQACSWACFKKRIEEASERPTANEKRKTAKKDTVKVVLSKTKKMKEEENENV